MKCIPALLLLVFTKFVLAHSANFTDIEDSVPANWGSLLAKSEKYTLIQILTVRNGHVIDSWNNTNAANQLIFYEDRMQFLPFKINGINTLGIRYFETHNSFQIKAEWNDSIRSNVAYFAYQLHYLGPEYLILEEVTNFDGSTGTVLTKKQIKQKRKNDADAESGDPMDHLFGGYSIQLFTPKKKTYLVYKRGQV